MTFSFRTHRFDAKPQPPDEDGVFKGKDAAEWLGKALAQNGWSTSVISEDWGWAVMGIQGEKRYVFGVYDHDLEEGDPGPEGARWVLRLFNQQMDPNVPWYRRLFVYEAPVASAEVIAEIEALLKGQPDFAAVQREPEL
jgi:hypothetical protein